MKCPVCGFENENDSQFCGNCGTPLIPEEPEKKGSKKTPVIIAVVIIVVIIAAALIGYFAYDMLSDNGDMIAMEETEGMWNTQPVKDWCCKDEAWCGFYQFLDEVKDEAERLGWGYVSNPAGGFWGCWWHFLSRKECELYWQIEKEGKLCLKIGSVNENREQVRGKWLDVVMKHKEECHLTELQRAPHLRLGSSCRAWASRC